MRSFVFIIAGLLFTGLAHSQLDKRNWLFGGSGSYRTFKRDFAIGPDIVEYKGMDISFSPAVGYFVADKLAVGLRPSFSWSKNEFVATTGNMGGGQGNNSWLYVGPFARYYLLEKAKNYNIVVDGSYSYGIESNFGENTANSHTIRFMAGPELYFNSSVGLELLLGYSSAKENYRNSSIDSRSDRGFLTTIGFQFHLGKGKK
jgi:hypothetical protein